MPETPLQLVLNAGAFVKVILLLLASFSVISWAIILYKYYHLSVAARESATFLGAFDAATDLKELVNTANALQVSPIANVFKATYTTRSHASREETGKSLRRHETAEAEKLQAYLTFLATTGSTAPFIGLLETVWGIMNAFRGIGATGSASLAVVAPGIAEALITTAGGLAAAIPAVMAYNYFLNWVRRLMTEMEDFSEELNVALSKRAP